MSVIFTLAALGVAAVALALGSAALTLELTRARCTERAKGQEQTAPAAGELKMQQGLANLLAYDVRGREEE